MKKLVLLLGFFLLFHSLHAENGYELWLRYQPIENEAYAAACREQLKEIGISGTSATMDIIRKEIKMGLEGMLLMDIDPDKKVSVTHQLVIGLPENLDKLLPPKVRSRVSELPNEGYLILREPKSGQLIISAPSDQGLLYASFHFLRLLQTRRDLAGLDISEAPRTSHRLLNHWDNLDRTVERGYAGFSIWDWHKLPDYIDQRYIDYARANASIGINGTVLTNVNANALVLTPQYLDKVKALADVFRPYGIKVYLTARFSAPMEIGGLPTADPIDAEVQQWWKKKCDEIYKQIPDFGGFLVKANSEGQPGPQDYERSHSEGANMLAQAVGPYGGIVMWRAFVYSHEVPDDRSKQAYTEFMPLDTAFSENVMIQVKNGPIDFQPREPFHPLFGAMEHTPLMMEFQITQEYTGCATHLVYLAPMNKEVLESDSYALGKGSEVSKAIDGSMYGHKLSGMAGVSNIGNDINWTGHPFAQANWYAYGRLAWNHSLSSEFIAEEWLRMTFSNEDAFLEILKPLMMGSREAMVNYMTPLGLHHQMARNHHWGPGPWVDGIRPDWTSVYYHRADSLGLGFDRTTNGSGATGQYFPEVKDLYDRLESCPEELLLWFHHVPWDYEMASGRSLWNELVYRHNTGVMAVRKMQSDWNSIAPYVDPDRFNQVKQLLAIQANEAAWWRDAMLLYFQQYSKMEIPEEYEQPNHDLDYYENLKFHFVPGIFNQ